MIGYLDGFFLGPVIWGFAQDFGWSVARFLDGLFLEFLDGIFIGGLGEGALRYSDGFLFGQLNGVVLGEPDWCALGGLCGQRSGQRFRNHGYWIVITDTPVPNEYISC